MRRPREVETGAGEGQVGDDVGLLRHHAGEVLGQHLLLLEVELAPDSCDGVVDLRRRRAWAFLPSGVMPSKSRCRLCATARKAGSGRGVRLGDAVDEAVEALDASAHSGPSAYACGSSAASRWRSRGAPGGADAARGQHARHQLRRCGRTSRRTGRRRCNGRIESMPSGIAGGGMSLCASSGSKRKYFAFGPKVRSVAGSIQ